MTPSGDPAPSAFLRRVVLAAVIVLPLLGLLPVVAGMAASDPPGRIFLGFAALPADHGQYASFAEQARVEPGLFLHDLMTTEEHPGRFLAAVPWLVGRLARISGADIVACWWALQYVGGALVLLATWAVAGRFTRSPGERLSAFLLATLVSGFEWITWLLARAGVERFERLDVLVQAWWNWNVTSSMVVPLWSLAQACLLLLVMAMLRQLRRPGVIGWMLLAGLAFGTWVLHPYTGAAAYAMVGLTAVVAGLRRLARAQAPAWREMFRRAGALSGVLPAVALTGAYAVWASRDPVVAHAAAAMTGLNRTFNPMMWPLVMGIPLLLAVYGLRDLREDDSAEADVLLAWTAAVAILAVGPWMSGYRFQFLLWIPVAILGARGLTWLRSRAAWVERASRRPVVVAAALLLASVGTFVGPLARARAIGADEHSFASGDELACLAAINEREPGIVVGPPERGPLMAWKTARPVHAAHHFLTIDPERKIAEARAALSPGLSDDERAELLRRMRARWVILPPASAGVRVEPWGTVAFSSGEWRVAEVR